MTAPITDDRLAKIRAGLEGLENASFGSWPRISPQTLLALLSRLDKAEAALWPFARWGARLSRDMPEAESGCAGFHDSKMPLLFRDFHAAADALPPPPSSES